MFGFGFDMGFGLFQIMFSLVFVLVVGIFAATAIREITEWNKNNHSPRLTVDATVIAKRTNVSHSHHHHGTGHMHHTSSSTTYYVTFQVASGDRGKLTFQGTRFLDFERS